MAITVFQHLFSQPVIRLLSSSLMRVQPWHSVIKTSVKLHIPHYAKPMQIGPFLSLRINPCHQRLNHLCCSSPDSAPFADGFQGGPEPHADAPERLRGPQALGPGAEDFPSQALPGAPSVRPSLSPECPAPAPAAAGCAGSMLIRVRTRAGHRERLCMHARMLPAWPVGQTD